MSYTDYTENAVINHLFRNTAMPVVSALRLALFTVAPTEAGGGTEVTGGGYARQTPVFGAPTNGVAVTTSAHTFTRTGTPVSVVALGYYDAATAGNLLSFAAITPALLGDGEEIVFAAGQLNQTLS